MIVTVPNNNAAGLPAMPRWETDYRIKSVLATFQNTTGGQILPIIRILSGGSTVAKMFRTTLLVDVAATSQIFWSPAPFERNPADVTSPPLQGAVISEDLVIRENDVVQLTDTTLAALVLITAIVFDIEPLGPLRFKGKKTPKPTAVPTS